MASYPIMSNSAHSRHHRNAISSAAPRKRSFIGQMFLSRNFDLDVSPTIDEKAVIKNDDLSRMKLGKEPIASTVDPPPSTGHPHAIRSNSEWSKPNWEIYSESAGRVRTSSAPTVVQGLTGFDHHHGHLERHPHTPQLHATRNFLRKLRL
ncbi:unnamed protein product [Toxocara canis]|uniref:Uncharacterized protein n=1 Tax=Toxocara canis TaxID=6265 RepID=A0A183UWA2_TOXCA|nr:unnamed protein product [Toxocara canis]